MESENSEFMKNIIKLEIQDVPQIPSSLMAKKIISRYIEVKLIKLKNAKEDLEVARGK